MAYCLLGIFLTSLYALVYGEGGTKAMNRLLREIRWNEENFGFLQQAGESRNSATAHQEPRNLNFEEGGPVGI